MKLLFAFLIFINIQNVFAQKAANTNYDKFCGDWKWVNGNDSFRIYIKIGQLPSVPDLDILVGCHKYIKNGITIVNKFPINLNQFNHQSNNSFISYIDENDINKTTGMIVDEPNNKQVRLILNYISPTSIKFSVLSMSGIWLNGVAGPIKLPSDIVLTKQ